MSIGLQPSARPKPSPDLAFTAWLIIILAAFQLQQSFDYNGLTEVYTCLYPKAWAYFYYGLTVFFLCIEIVLGFNILRLREWARKGILILVVFYILSTFSMSLTVNKNYFGYIQGSLTELQQLTQKLKWHFAIKRKQLDKMRQMASTPQERQAVEALAQQEKKLKEAHFWSQIVLGVNIGALLLKFFLWYIFAVIYFSRPRIKKQFV